MTLKTNARLAGAAFLLYIAIGLTSLFLYGKVLAEQEGTAAKFANIGQNTSTIQVVILLNLLSAACALVLAITLHALTRDRDRDISLMGMCCRVAEGIIIVAGVLVTLAMQSVAASGNVSAEDSFGGALLKVEGSTGTIAAICFAVGSTFFCYLFLQARNIPVWLAWLGVFASVILVIVLPLQLVGYMEGGFISLIWMPMLLFELVLAFWLIIKGVAMPVTKGMNVVA